MSIQTKTMTVKSDTSLAETTTTIRDIVTFDVSNMPNGITYKGLKAVLSFAEPIQWNKASTYDALTVVWDDASHGSYASKRPVPANIELTNEFYWLRTADLDAQVEMYRQEVREMDGRVTANTNAIATLAAKDSFFETVADMKKAGNLANNMICHTNGFHASGDNGDAWYIISDNGTANEMDVIKCGEYFATLVLNNNSITPEMLGAYGNGVIDDSSIFERITQLAVEGKIGIVNCAYEAVYNLANTDVFNSDLYENLQFNGNNCTFKNGSFVFNLDTKNSNTWKVSYPKPSIIVKNCTFNNESYNQPPFISGSPIIFEYCSFTKCNGAVAYPFVYMDVNIFKNCTFTQFKNKFINVSTTNFNEGSKTFGDNHTYINCHSHQQTELSEGLFVNAYGCNPLTIDNCINIGAYLEYECSASIEKCHFESKPIEFKSTAINAQSVHFADCVFLASIPDAFVSSEKIRYDNCTWISNSNTHFKTNNKGNLFSIMGSGNKIITGDESGSYPTLYLINSEGETVNRFRTGTYTNDIAPYINVNNGAGIHEFIESGDYKYNIFLSTFKDTIVGAQPTLWEKIISILDTSVGVRFTVSKSINNMWLHFYRTLPSGKIQKAVVQFGSGSNSVYDYGLTIASVPWENVNAIPEPDMKGIASLSNSVLVTNSDYADTTHANVLSINQSTKLITGFAPQTATVIDF